MQNYLKDFRLHRNADGDETAWTFRFGTCSDFDGALATVKAIPVHRRTYDPDTKEWRVRAGPVEAVLLGQAFSNFAGLREQSRRQMTLL